MRVCVFFLHKGDVKPDGHEAMSAKELNAAQEAAIKEKEAVICSRAEEKRSAIRREAIGWDRC